MQKLRKALAISVMSVTVLSTSMFSVSFAGAATSIAAGDLIKTNSSSAVYYVGADMKKNVFPDANTYFSWYSDFSGVTVVSQDEFNALSWGGNVTMRPGTKMVKIQSDPRVYAVEPGGKLKHIPSEAVATTIYGANWAKRVVDISDTVFVSSYDKNPTELTTAFPAGSLVKDGGAAVYYFDGVNYRSIANEAAFYANRFSFANLVTTTAAITAGGAAITGAESALTNTAAAGTPVVVIGGSGLTVALSSATPEAGNAPIGASVDFFAFNLTASNDGAVNVSSIKLSAYNLGDADDMTNVSFYDNGVKVGTSKTLSASDRNAVFNFATPIVVAAGTTKTLTVKATLAAGATSNYALGVTAAADIVTGGAAVSGSFPVVGNTKSGVDATLGAFDFDNVGTTDTSNKFGEDNVLLAAFDIEATSAEDLLVSTLRLRNGGTNSDSIASNLRLVIDGEDVQTGVSIVDRYASFNAGNYLIEKGQSVSVEVYGDLGIGSANDTIGLYLKETTDISVVGKTFGYDLVATSDADLTTLMTLNGGVVVTLTAGDFTIDMDKIATPAKDIRADSTNVVLATIKMTSNSENATLAGIGAGLTVTGGTIQGDELNAFELVDLSTGSIYDLTADGVADATYNLTMTDEVSFVKDVTKTFALRADVLTTADVNDYYMVTLAGTALSLTGDVSDSAITNITPGSVAGANQTVKDATLSWTTTTLTDKTVVTGAADVSIYSASVKAGDVSPITISSVKLDVVADDGDVNGSFIDSNITKLDLYINNVLVKSISNGITEAAAPDGYITFSSLDATKRVVAKGATVPVEVKATFASSFATSSTWSVGVVAAGSITAKDDQNNTVTATGPAATGSRTITLASVGTLKTELLTTDSKANANVYQLAGSTKTSGDAYVAEVKFTAANEPVKVKTLVLAQEGTATSADIKTVSLYNSTGTVIASTGVTASGHAVFTNLALTIPADSSASYFVGVQTKSISAENDAEGTATHGRTIIFALAGAVDLVSAEVAVAKAVEADGADSGQAITLTEDANGTVVANEYSASTTDSKTATISGAILTSIVNTMTDGTLTGGAGKTIGKYKMVFDNGANRYNNAELMAQLKELKLTVATSSAVVTAVQAYIDGASTDKTAAVAVISGEATIDLSSGLANSSQVDGEITLVITGTVSGVAANAYVQTSIADLTTDFTYDGDGNGTPVGVANSLLSISEVIGATLSN